MAREPKPERDIRTLENGEVDWDFYWRKVAAAGDMKSAIKRLLDEAMPVLKPAGGGDVRHSTRKPHDMFVPTRRPNEARKAMEDYLNVV